MRTLAKTLYLVGFFLVGAAHAQTWTHPVSLAYQTTQVLSENTCMGSDTIEIYDNSFISPGPDIVYLLRNRQPVGMPHYTSARITVLPYSTQDFEIFACQQEFGNTVQNCPLEADNLGNQGQPVQLTIPNQYETYHIIVTAGNFAYSAACTPFTLVVQRMP